MGARKKGFVPGQTVTDFNQKLYTVVKMEGFYATLIPKGQSKKIVMHVANLDKMRGNKKQP